MPILSESALALFLLEQARSHDRLIGILRGAGRLDRVGRLATALADGVEVIILPPQDVLPYDLLPPSPVVVGQRVKALTELSRAPTGPRLLLTSATAALQRVRPAIVWQEATVTLTEGDAIDPDRLRAALAERAYHWDERIDEPGEVAIRGHVIDVFPAGSLQPARLLLEAGRIAAISCVDPVTLRSTHRVESIELRPATEYRVDDGDMTGARALLEPGVDTHAYRAELQLPRRLISLFDLLDDSASHRAACYRDDEVEARWHSVRDGIDDAYEAARKAGRLTGESTDLPPPDRLFLAVSDALAATANCIVPIEPAGDPVHPPRRIDELLELVKVAGDVRIVITTPSHAESVAASLRKRGLDANARMNVTEITPGEIGILEADPAVGLRAPGLLLIPVGGLLRPRASTNLALGDEAPRIGETVVHLEHGICRLLGLRDVHAEDRVALEFADGVELLIAADELDRVWRYGDGNGVLDRLGGESWRGRRNDLHLQLQQTAVSLAERAAARQASVAPVLHPPAAGMSQIARRFPYKLSQDQRAAIHAVLDDLASGHRMDRLLCGDVGFGKTEIAIRAAAAAALAGHQVAIAAPTTVLARQHLETFRTRFSGTGLRVDSLPSASTAAGSRAFQHAVASGAINIVVGTHGIAGLDFARLALVIIDEEQRFGESDKHALAALAPHVLAMTATPIPRTMQEALVGLRDVSVLATPPQMRQPGRTFVLPWDKMVVREALLREHRRGGQSFVVCARIADLDAMAGELAALVPGLVLVRAHGRMQPELLEAAIVDFAAGHGDILLATNIIEAGLDIPRANLMIVADSDRFGLAQLHQLRGRVGRGTRRGNTYFLTAPDRPLSEATRRRLTTIQSLAALGAGVALSAADLDLRGAGDLFGERQSGHVRAVGTELYQHLLMQALAYHRGLEPPVRAPELHIELAGGIPASYVPEPNLRIALLRRLARLDDLSALKLFELELEDRFGPLPLPTTRILLLARLRLLCRAHRIARVDAGRQACAFTPQDLDGGQPLADAVGGTAKGRRIILRLTARDPLARAEAIATALGG